MNKEQAEVLAAKTGDPSATVKGGRLGCAADALLPLNLNLSVRNVSSLEQFFQSLVEALGLPALRERLINADWDANERCIP